MKCKYCQTELDGASESRTGQLHDPRRCRDVLVEKLSMEGDESCASCIWCGRYVFGSLKQDQGCGVQHLACASMGNALKTKAQDDALEEAGVICDNYGSEGDRHSQEYAGDTACELAARIRKLKSKEVVTGFYMAIGGDRSVAVTLEADGAGWFNVKKVETTCDKCKGTGYYQGPRLGDEPCSKCKGTGRLLI